MGAVKRRCLHCDEPILPGDHPRPLNGGSDWMHPECFLRSVVGSVAHQERRCSCHGGDGEDDPRLTRREAARAAAETYAAARLLEER